MSTETKSPAVIDAQIEVVGASALEAITKGEIDIQIATAHKFPRSMALFVKKAKEMACLDEDTAASCLYSRPVGMKDGKQQFAEGLSVRMAEIVAACYGNIRVGAMVIEQTPRRVVVRGYAHDLENNTAMTSEVIEATVKRPKPGQTQGDPYDERMSAVIAKAALSKALRDAIFRVVPKALAKPIENAVRALLVGDAKSTSQRRTAVDGWVKSLGIDPARVWRAMGVNGLDDLTADHLEKLTGLRSAIKDADTTIDEAFPPIIATGGIGAGKPEEKPPAGGTAKTPTELAAEEKAKAEAAGASGGGNATQGEPQGGAAPESKKEESSKKGPSAADLRKNLVNKGAEINAGKVGILKAAKSLGIVKDADAKWDDLDAATLAHIDDAWEDVKEKIQHPE